MNTTKTFSADMATKIRNAVGAAFLKAVMNDELRFIESGTESELLARLDSPKYESTGFYDEDGNEVFKRTSPIGRWASLRWYAHSVVKSAIDGRIRKLPKLTTWNSGTRTAEPCSPEDLAAAAYSAMKRWEAMPAIPSVEAAREAVLS